MSGLSAIYDITMMTLLRQGRDMARLMEQGAGGLRVIRASDDPADAYAILNYQAQAASLAAYGKNIDQVSQQLTQASGVLQSFTDGLSRIQQLASQGASGTYSQDQRTAIAEEIDSQLETLVSQANGQYMGRSLFAGSSAGRAAYEVDRQGGRIVDVRYVGSLQANRVPIAPGVEQSPELVGARVFASDSRQAPAFDGTTGLRAGAGTSSIRGDAWLTVSHDTTTYGGTTGIAAGAGSAGGDTIVGDSHVLRLDATAHTVALDDGTVVAFGAGSTNLELRNAAGEVAYVDLSSLDGALTGQATVQIHATAKASLDDGATCTVLDFSANQAVRDGRTGQVLYVDSSGLQRIGVEPVKVPGTYDLFRSLVNIRDLLLNSRNLSPRQQADQLNQSLPELKEVTAGVTTAMTTVGGRLQAMDRLKQSLEDLSGSAGDQAAALQDVDVAQLAIDLSRNQTFYQMTLASTSKLLSLSLLDYLTQ